MTKLGNVNVELVVSVVLRVGVLLAFIIVSTAGAIYLIQHHGDTLAFQQFQGENSDLRTLGSIWRFALGLRTDALIQLGLVVLIVTPIARVLMAAIGFAIDGDRLYLAVSVIVLGFLLFGFFHAV